MAWREPTPLEKRIAVAMTDAMSQHGLWESALEDNLRTLDDCDDQAIRELEEVYLGKEKADEGPYR